MIKKWVSIFCLIFLMVTTVVWAKPDSAYVDNGNGTVTDIETKLMWQKETPRDRMNWEEATSYLHSLNLFGSMTSLANYTGWRLPTIEELKTLVDKSWGNEPTINRTFFPGTKSYPYWSSTYTFVSYPDGSHTWMQKAVDFYDGREGAYKKDGFLYVRAVRELGNLVISPLSQMVTKDAGSTIFSVSNLGNGTMRWTMRWFHEVTSGSSWLTITSGPIGWDTGTLTCAYTANTGTSSRTGTIRVTAPGITGSPTYVTVTQAPTPTECTTTTDGNLSLHIPYLSYIDPVSETPLSFSADLVNLFNDKNPALILYQMTDLKITENPSFSCAASTLSDDFKIHIPDVLLPDGITHLWMELDYIPAFSNYSFVYFEVKKFGIVSN